MYISAESFMRGSVPPQDAFVVLHKTFRMAEPGICCVFQNQQAAIDYAWDKAVMFGPVQESITVDEDLPLTTVYKVAYTDSQTEWFSVVKAELK